MGLEIVGQAASPARRHSHQVPGLNISHLPLLKAKRMALWVWVNIWSPILGQNPSTRSLCPSTQLYVGGKAGGSWLAEPNLSGLRKKMLWRSQQSYEASKAGVAQRFCNTS